jgi:hypothetical protein
MIQTLSKITNIIVNTRFSAIHSWPDCDIAEVDYLRNPHRHEFHITVKAHVTHDNRYIEFIQLKNKINQFLRNNWEEKNLGRLSCEMMAEKLRQEFPICFYVRIMEDGENGAEIITEKY